ncbi:MAG: hypothetical protein U0W24_07890 [Bacteroidales bacterium]
MGTMELKSELINLINEIQNENLLKAIYVLITHKPVPSAKGLRWEDLPKDLQIEIEEGLEQAEKGEVVEHEEVMKKYKKWL